MTDDQLLHLAAKALGITYHGDGTATKDGKRVYWDPLTSSGDALDGAVQIGRAKTLVLTVGCGGSDCELHRSQVAAFQPFDGGDWLAANRRAITRALAAIGEGME